MNKGEYIASMIGLVCINIFEPFFILIIFVKLTKVACKKSKINKSNTIQNASKIKGHLCRKKL